MRKFKAKTLLVAAAALALGGAVAYKEFVPGSYAAEVHGDDHGNHEGHDEGSVEHGHEDAHGHGAEEGELAEGVIELTEEQIAKAAIEVSPAGSGSLAREITVPGKIIAAADRMAQVVPKVSGTVTEARKNLGDTVAKGEILALIESREMAEAVADHLAARRAAELAHSSFNREKGLWEKKITAEQDYLAAKNAEQEAQIRLDLTRQKLQALGHNGDVPANGSARFHELKSPLGGRVIDRELTLGEYVDATHSAYTVADLSVIWVETAISSGDLSLVNEGQPATVSSNGNNARGKLIFVSPSIDPETRAAKAIIELENMTGKWRPGQFANVAITTSTQDVSLLLPKDALQTIENEKVVFVRTDKGFEKREVATGREDSGHVEILSGISPGDAVAVTNSFTLKAELGKAEAEHEH